VSRPGLEDEKGKTYLLERHGQYWRLRREGNKTGTIRHHDREQLRARGLVSGWRIVDGGNDSGESPGVGVAEGKP
jgi:hypothetical protein